MTGFLEAVPRRHQQPKNLLDTRSAVSAFSDINIAKETLFIDLTLCKNGNSGKREWFSHSGHWLTPACVPVFSTGDRYELDWCTNLLSIANSGRDT